MRSLCSALLFAFLSIPTCTAAATLDPREVDILGLRLGMTESDIVGRLLSQGVARLSIQEEHGKCLTEAEDVCIDRITAPTRDGTLRIRFAIASGASQATAWSIAYTLTGRLPGEPGMIRDAVLDRFGQPSGGPDPLYWCAHVSGSECSPADQPQITFSQGPGTASTLTLVDPTAIIRAGP
ncbi:MAG TPA: hypothetical protein VGG99_12040 [Acetobacteraceae bacterium]|jgi:hypothetical protein